MPSTNYPRAYAQTDSTAAHETAERAYWLTKVAAAGVWLGSALAV